MTAVQISLPALSISGGTILAERLGRTWDRLRAAPGGDAHTAAAACGTLQGVALVCGTLASVCLRGRSRRLLAIRGASGRSHLRRQVRLPGQDAAAGVSK